ncbi:MAG: Hpt domain-containing protein, partial [Methyloversatilis sp.]|nr:Hpt domain-containing protein [Methyloversatilis sp.]
MTMDLSQFYQVFFEEAAEHLSNMEQMLLDINLDSLDDEEMNAIFRAAHSIKGSAGTFGFNDLAQVTHELETLLDRVRKHEVLMTPAMVNASLEAGDLLRDLVAAHRGIGEADLQRVAQVCAALKSLYSDVVEPARACERTESVPLSAVSTLRFSFLLLSDHADVAGVIENLAREAGALGGRLLDLSLGADGRWHGVFEGSVDVEALRDLVDFVAVTDSFVLTAPVTDADDAYGLFDALPETLSDGDNAWGLFDAALPDTASTADDSYGLFDAEPVAPTSGNSQTGDPSYGFFDPPAGQAVVDAPGADAGLSIVSPAAATREECAVNAPVEALIAPSIEAPKAAAPRSAKPAAVADTSIRVGVDKVDQIINLVGELVITQAMLMSAASKLDPVEFERLMSGVQQLERNTRDLQESVMSIRMLPMSTVFSRFPRVVRDLSQKLGKKVRLVLAGESTELDKGLIERIADPLTHLVRNSLDHGVETPEVRVARGKPEEGTITLKASHQGGNIVIEVGDDGAGLSRERILSKARERGLAVSDSMTDQDVWALIFEPGFSTADQVTEVSGRGVGMDVVKRNISAMGGRVDIDSMSGVVTRMTVRLP